jgi:cytochrome c-type biogenesis protein CcmH
MKNSIFALVLLAGPVTYGADIPMTFENAAEQERYQGLLEELRCLVCQNQSLADSHADLAQDLRNEVYRMVKEGQADQEILQFLVTRYGDFVLYRPPLKASTLLLWFGPFVLLALALAGVYRFINSRRVEAEVVISREDEERLARIFDEPGGKQGS